MPAYNMGKYISESIESVINQTYKNWELIVIDDGSTDNTATIINDYKCKESRIKYLFQPNGKQGKARNLGIKNSTGKYIAFLDADDKWTTDKLTTQLEAMNTDDRIDLLFCQGYSLDNDKIEDYNVAIKEVWDSTNFNDFIYHNQIPILSVLVKSAVINQVNGFTEDEPIQNAEDYHLWLKLLANGKRFRSVADRLFYYRTHPDQATFQNNNLEKPVFNACRDIFYSYPAVEIRKPIIDKLKWLVFAPAFHEESIHLIIAYFNDRKKPAWGFIINHFFSGPNIVSKKMVFKIVSTFG